MTASTDVPVHKSLWSLRTSRTWSLAKHTVEEKRNFAGNTFTMDTWRTPGMPTSWRNDGDSPPFVACRSLVLDPADDAVMSEFADAVAAEVPGAGPDLITTLRAAVLNRARCLVPQITDLQIGGSRRVFDAVGHEWAERRSDRLWVCLDSLDAAPRNLTDLIETHGPVSTTKRDRPLGYLGQRWHDMAAIETTEGSGVFEYAYWHAVEKCWVTVADDRVIDGPYRKGRPVLVVNRADTEQVVLLAALIAETEPAVTAEALNRALAHVLDV